MLPTVMSRTFVVAGLTALSMTAAGPAGAQAVNTAENLRDQVNEEDLGKTIITGSRISRLDVEGPLPVLTIGRDEIEKSGKTSLGDIILELPFTQGDSFTVDTNASFAAGQSSS